MELPKHIKDRLISYRNKMLSGNKDVDCRLGKLAYDIKNGEFGFIIGPMKFKQDKNFEKANPMIRIERFLMVTIDKNTDDFRIRYPNKNNIITFPEEEVNLNVSSDLALFCNDQCIFECSEDCVLYKYRKIIKKNE